MQALLALALAALPVLAWAQESESAVRRVIDAQLATGATQPPGPGVPGSEAARLLGGGAGQQQAPAPPAAPVSAGSPFAAPARGGGAR